MADNAPANPEPEKEGLRCRSTRSPATGGLLSPPWSSKVSEKKEFVFVKKNGGRGRPRDKASRVRQNHGRKSCDASVHACGLLCLVIATWSLPSTFPYGFLDRSRKKVGIKPTHDLVRVLWTHRSNIHHGYCPIDDVFALLWMFSKKWMPTPLDLYQES